MKIGKYMTVYPVGIGPREVYLVKDSDGRVIGSFEWYSRWRQYVFEPEHGAVFSHDCLAELSRFCKRPEISPS